MQKKISIIISTQNRASYLPRALDSIIAQTFSDYDVWIADDASIDETPVVLDSYKKSIANLHVISQKSPLGTTKNAKILIEMSKSKYIARLDDDDVWENDKLEKQIAFLETHSQVGLLGTAIRGITHDSKFLAPKINLENDKEIRTSMIRVNPFAQSSVIFRRDTYEQVGGYDPSFTTEDYELWLRIGAHGWQLANLGEILTYIGVTEGQISHKKRRKLILSEIRATWKYRKNYPGFYSALIVRLGAWILPQRLSSIIGSYLRK